MTAIHRSILTAASCCFAIAANAADIAMVDFTKPGVETQLKANGDTDVVY